MFGYGFLAVVLVLYLAALGLDPLTIGAILTLTLVGDTLISLWLTTNADRIGRRRVLIAGSLLMVVFGILEWRSRRQANWATGAQSEMRPSDARRGSL